MCAVPGGELLRGRACRAADVPAAQHVGSGREQRGRVRVRAWLRFRDRKWGMCKVQRRELLSWRSCRGGLRSQLDEPGGGSSRECVHMLSWHVAGLHASGRLYKIDVNTKSIVTIFHGCGDFDNQGRIRMLSGYSLLQRHNYNIQF